MEAKGFYGRASFGEKGLPTEKGLLFFVLFLIIK